jgi:hypothetical protein
MKRKLLLESEDFVKKYNYYSDKITKLLPSIEKLIKSKFKDILVEVELSTKMVNYASDSFTGRETVISLFFDENLNHEIKKEIFEVIIDYFDIPIFEYGVPLSLELYKLKWERF